MGTPLFHALPYRLGGRERFLLWFTSEDGGPDGIVLEGGFAPSFESRAALRSFAALIGVELEPGPTDRHDLDLVARWTLTRDPAKLDASQVLLAWNLFADLSRSTGVSFEASDDEYHGLHRVLHLASNLPGVAGELYEAHWTGDQCLRIANVLASGLALFRERVRPAG